MLDIAEETDEESADLMYVIDSVDCHCSVKFCGIPTFLSSLFAITSREIKKKNESKFLAYLKL